MRLLKYIKSNILYILFALFALILVLNNVYGFFMELKYGSGNYYVNLFEEDTESKNYRVIGEVDYDSEFGEYLLIRATFPNGGYISFDNSHFVSPLEFYEKVHMEDDNGRDWYVELTKEKVKVD